MPIKLLGLAGPPGVGKTTFARFLHERAGWATPEADSPTNRRVLANGLLDAGEHVVLDGLDADDLAWVEHKGGACVTLLDPGGDLAITAKTIRNVPAMTVLLFPRMDEEADREQLMASALAVLNAAHGMGVAR